LRNIQRAVDSDFDVKNYCIKHDWLYRSLTGNRNTTAGGKNKKSASNIVLKERMCIGTWRLQQNEWLALQITDRESKHDRRRKK